MRKISGLAWALGTAAALAACGGGSKEKTGGTTSNLSTTMGGEKPDDLKVPKVDPSLCSAEGGDKRVAAYDLNHDNKPDEWKIYKSKNDGTAKVEVLTCKQVDLDRDAQSRKDYVVEYDDSGQIILEEFDFDFDGKFDARRHYDPKTGKKILVERNTDFDDKPDLWEEYDKNERLDRVLRDRNADGKPDYWELYRDGQLETILYDEDFDGKVDKREDAAPPKPEPPPATPPGTTDQPAGGATAPAPATTDKPADAKKKPGDK
jgi:hypothetical protein